MKNKHLKQNVYSKTHKYSVVTFDVFNTLINRKVFKPNDVLELLDYFVSNKYSLPLKKFLSIRKKASNRLAKKLNKAEYTLDDLYSQIQKITNWDSKTINQIKNDEINLDVSLSVPREEMVELFNFLIKNKKKVFIVSDMYYSKETIVKFLKANHISGYSDIWVSSDKQAKKSDGTIWKQFAKLHPQKFIHIGDSRRGDYSKPKRLGFDALKINPPYKQARLSKFSCVNNTLEDKIINGLIFNKCLFNSPFVKSTNPIDTPYKYGYSIIGPLFLYFFIWLTKNFKDKDKLFFSRDGYFLEKLYIKFCKKIGIPAKSQYLLTSRKTACVASLKNINDINKYIDMYGYKGTTKAFFASRFGITIDDKYNKKINHRITSLLTKKVALVYKDEILKLAKQLRTNYLKYLNKYITKNSLFIDLGYHSTTQIKLSKLLQWNVPGAYFLTVGRKVPNVYPCFNKIFKLYSLSNTNKVLKIIHVSFFIKLVETVLAAPHGQLIDMDSKGNPIFNKDQTIKTKLKASKTITDACWDFINDFLDIYPLPIQKVNLNLKQIYKNFVTLYKLFARGYISESLHETFVEENEMCGLDKHYMFKKKK